MTAAEFRFGFRILGKTCEPRRLVDAGAAFAAYAACDPRADLDHEAYLSAFWFGEDFRGLLTSTGSTAGFCGPCWSHWLWFDLDNEDLHYSHQDAGGLVAFLVERFGIEADGLLIFFSGSKGFHVGLPTALWSPSPSLDFHRTARRFAESLAEQAAVTIDAGVYDAVRAFRAPNSRHPKTGLHKRRLSFAELCGPLDAITELAKAPAPFDVPTCSTANEQAAADWQAAVERVATEDEAKAARRAAGNGSPTLNKATMIFIRDGASNGDRHRLLFSAAANLAEFGCPASLAVALLEESALDSGLAPKDVRRQVECGLSAAGSASSVEPTRQDCAGRAQVASDGSTIENAPERDTGDSGAFIVQSCQQVTRATESRPAADLPAALARLWQSPTASRGATTEAAAPSLTDSQGFDWATGRQTTAPVLPALPPPLPPLPAGAVGSGTLDKPCRCGSTEYAEIPIGEGRTRRDCRKCRRFAGFGRWHEGGAT
jgi:hypothetical protein